MAAGKKVERNRQQSATAQDTWQYDNFMKKMTMYGWKCNDYNEINLIQKPAGMIRVFVQYPRNSYRSTYSGIQMGRRRFVKKEAVYTELEYYNMVFRYKGKNGTYELFRTRYRHTIYEYFRCGRGVGQLHADRSWLKSRFLSKIVEERLWKEIRRARKEDANAGRGNEGLH